MTSRYVQFIYLDEKQSPPQQRKWLLIVKTRGHDFEVVACFGDGTSPMTLGKHGLLQSARENAEQIASELRFETVYILGVKDH